MILKLHGAAHACRCGAMRLQGCRSDDELGAGYWVLGYWVLDVEYERRMVQQEMDATPTVVGR